MNILLYSHTFLPKIGGREIVVYQLARALGQLGHEVRVVGPRLTRKATARGDDAVRVNRYPRLVRGTWMGSTARLSALREREMLAYLVMDAALHGVDVIHAHTTYPTGYVGGLARRWLPRTPLVITPHGYDINVLPDFGMRLDPLIDTKIGYALNAAHALTAISEGVEQSLKDAGADPDRIHRIPNGTDLERFARPPELDVRARFGIPENSRIVLSVGNYHPRKGQEDLIRALPAVLERQPRTRLVIVGGQTDVLRPLVAEMGVAASVVLTGPLPTPFDLGSGRPADCLAALYQACAVYVSASNDSGAEGLSLAVLDAMAAGRPVVATRISGNEDVVSHGRNGLLVAPRAPGELAAAVVALLDDPGAGERMGSAGREIAGTMSWLNVARQYLGVYQAISNTGPVAAAAHRDTAQATAASGE